MNDTTIGVGVALAVVTTGAMLVYTALKGKTVAQVLAGDIGAPLNAIGGITDATTPGGDTTNQGVGGAGALGAPPLGGIGTTVIDGHTVANWIAKDVLCARAHGWTGQVTS